MQKAAQEAKKLAEEAKEVEEAAKAGATDSVSRAIDWVFAKLPFLEPLRDPLQPVIDFLVANALYVRLGLGLGLMIFVWLLSRMFVRTTPVRARLSMFSNTRCKSWSLLQSAESNFPAAQFDWGLCLKLFRESPVFLLFMLNRDCVFASSAG